MGSQDHVILMFFSTCAVSLVLIALSLLITLHPDQTVSHQYQERQVTPAELSSPSWSPGGRAAIEYDFSHHGSEETNAWGMNGMSSLVRVGEVFM